MFPEGQYPTAQAGQVSLDYPFPSPGYPPAPIQYPPYRTDQFSDYMLWGLIGVVALGGLTWLGFHLVHKGTGKKEERKSLDKNDPASIAQELKIGFENNGKPGADMERVRNTILAIPDQATFRKVAESYEKLPGRSPLATDLKRYLYGSEHQEIKAILDAKPEKEGMQPIYDPYLWAKRLRAGVLFETWGFMWGTDEDAVSHVLKEIPSRKAWEDVKAAYALLYPGYTLIGDLEGDGLEYEHIINQKPIA